MLGQKETQVHVADDTCGLFWVMSLLALCRRSRILLYRSIEYSHTVRETPQSPFTCWLHATAPLQSKGCLWLCTRNSKTSCWFKNLWIHFFCLYLPYCRSCFSTKLVLKRSILLLAELCICFFIFWTGDMWKFCFVPPFPKAYSVQVCVEDNILITE